MIFVVSFTLKEDLANRLQYEIKDFERKKQICIEEYYKNECEPEKRVPFLIDYCNEREKCLNSNAELEIGKTRTTFSVFVEIINEIADKLSWNSLFLIFLVYFSLVSTFLLFMKSQKK